jgi:hypothetical protein
MPKSVKRPVRDLHSDKPTPPRFCDVIVEGDMVFLEKKSDKNKYEKIPWDDVVYQVEAAKAANQ